MAKIQYEVKPDIFKYAKILKQAPWSRIRILGECWQWETNGQCLKGDNCSFRHDLNKRAKSTQPNPSPRSSTRQNVKNASRTRSPRGKFRVEECFECPARITSKELAPIHSVKSGILQNARSASRRKDVNWWISALMRIARLTNSQLKGPKRMMTRVQWLY